MAGCREQLDTSSSPEAPRAAWSRSPGVVLAAGASLVALIVVGESVVALAILLMEGSLALAVLASAARRQAA